MQKLGLVLIVGSFLLWLAIVLIMPLLPLSLTQKPIIVTVLAVVSKDVLIVKLLIKNFINNY